MMAIKLTTPVDIRPSVWKIDHQSGILLLGSCFTDHIGQRLSQAGFNVLCNPFGVLYNPLSIAACLTMATNGQHIDDTHLVQHDGLWHSWLHHSRFSHADKEYCIDACNEAIAKTHDFLSTNPVLIITFGTAYTFFLNRENSPMHGRPVANCHKLPPQNFVRKRLSIDEITAAWAEVLHPLSSLIQRLILTVSPIRHMADTAHGNQLSKATLLLASDQILQQKPASLSANYFDSYELLLDELRDYRFYDRDLCHPDPTAIDIIWDRFQQTYMSAATIEQCAILEKESKRQRHRAIVQR